jgi:hypothetical protein
MVSEVDEAENGPFEDWGFQHSRGYLAVPVDLHASVDHANPDSKRGGVTVKVVSVVAIVESMLTKRWTTSRQSC